MITAPCLLQANATIAAGIFDIPYSCSDFQGTNRPNIGEKEDPGRSESYSLYVNGLYELYCFQLNLGYRTSSLLGFFLWRR